MQVLFLLLTTFSWAIAGIDTQRGAVALTINTTAKGHRVAIYKNIRFAAPPVGELRFRYPVSLNESTSRLPIPADTQCVSSVPSEAPYPGINGTSFGSEDCLFLDVYTPHGLPSNASVRVIHWLYGSGYAFGSKDLFANPLGLFDELLSHNTPFVFVASNYRMGLYGWASSPDEFDAMDTNVGLADGLAALQWTSRHIADFGGNPDEVTVMGQSAGSGMIELLITNAQKQALPFSRAILSSAAIPLKRHVYGRRQQLYHDMLQLSNCSSTRCLRELLEGQLEAVNDILVSKSPSGGGGGTFGPYLGFGPFVDGHLVRNLTSITLRTHPNDKNLKGLVCGLPPITRHSC